jgi:hypothetical protein
MKGEDCLILETAFSFYCLMEAGRHVPRGNRFGSH